MYMGLLSVYRLFRPLQLLVMFIIVRTSTVIAIAPSRIECFAPENFLRMESLLFLSILPFTIEM